MAAIYPAGKFDLYWQGNDKMTSLNWYDSPERFRSDPAPFAGALQEYYTDFSVNAPGGGKILLIKSQLPNRQRIM